MQVQFQTQALSCLEPVVYQAQNMEQTQEVRLPEGAAGVGRVICAWGQSVLRSKQWQGNSLTAGAGMTVWVLYTGEDEGKLHWVESWVPFQLRWEVPEGTPEGTFLVSCRCRFVDARLVGAGRLMVRCGISALCSAFAGKTHMVASSGEIPEGMETLTRDYPVRLPMETGEKIFSVEESLSLPAAAPQPGKSICWQLDNVVTESRILGSRLVFRGNLLVQVIYESEEGQLHTWEFQQPFSQYAQLEKDYSADASAELWINPTEAEIKTDDSGTFQLRCSLTAQYLTEDRKLLHLTEDARFPGRELTMQRQTLELPVLLDTRRENVGGHVSMEAEGDVVVDARLLTEFPRVATGEETEIALAGLLQTLYYDTQGQLQCSVRRWEASHSLKTHPDTIVCAIPRVPQVQVSTGSAGLEAAVDVPLQISCCGGQGLEMVTELTVGEERMPDANRPSLVLCRADRESLWELAGRNGSSVAAIREANGLEGESERGRILLIPVL